MRCPLRLLLPERHVWSLWWFEWFIWFYVGLPDSLRDIPRYQPRRTLQHFLLDPTLPQTSLLAIGQTTFSADTTTLPSLRLDSLQEEEVPMLTSTVHMDGPLEEMPAKTVMIFAVDTANCTLVSASLLVY